MNFVSQSYYLIAIVVKSGEDERLYPMVFEDLELAEKDYNKLLHNNPSPLQKHIGGASELNVKPFLFVEKTYISNDKFLVPVDSHSTSGSLDSEIIPVDYVSKIYQANKLKPSKYKLAGLANKIIDEANNVGVVG